MWFCVRFEDHRDEFIKAPDRSTLDAFVEKRVQSPQSSLSEQPTDVEEAVYSDEQMVSEQHSPLHDRKLPWRAIDPTDERSMQYVSRCNMSGHNTLYASHYPDVTAKTT